MSRTATENTGPESEPDLKEYPVRVSVTVRVHATTFISARDGEHAVELAKLIDPRDFTFKTDGDTEIDGDEIAYIEDPDDEMADDLEADLRAEGEPFSWEACQIVKELAALAGEPDSIRALEADALIERARAACSKEA